jgi:hypothetical protein
LVKKLTVLVCGAALLSSAVAGFALPTLQLDIPGGVFNTTDNTTYSTSGHFDLVALLSGTLDPSRTYYISAAITPRIGQGEPAPNGAFQMGSTVFSVANLQYGTPPANVTSGKTLPAHEIFPTYYGQYAFNFDALHTVPAYDVATGKSAGGSLYAFTLSVDTSPLLAGYGLHFGLFDEKIDDKGNWTVDDFAPASHDAQSITNTTTNTVSDTGATVALFGLALVGLAFVPKRQLARIKARR